MFPIQGKEVADRPRDLLSVGLEREVARVEKPNVRIRNSRLNASAPAGRKNGSLLPHTARNFGLFVRKYVLECRIKRDVALVIAEQIQLNFVGSGARQIALSSEYPSGETEDLSDTPCVYCQIVASGLRRHAAPRGSLPMLPANRRGLDSSRRSSPPLGVAILRDDRRDALRMPQRKAKAGRRTIVEDVDRKALETHHLGEAVDHTGDVVERVLNSLAPACPTGQSQANRARRGGSDQPAKGSSHETCGLRWKAVEEKDGRRLLRTGFSIVMLKPSTSILLKLTGFDGL